MRFYLQNILVNIPVTYVYEHSEEESNINTFFENIRFISR